MRVSFVSRESLPQSRQNFVEGERDVLLFGFGGLGEVFYEKELTGESNFFEEGAKLSKLGKTIVVCGCITNSRGYRRKSALVAENGKLLGVSDMLHALDGGYGSGAELRIYPTKMGKMGVVVAEDLYFSDTVKSLVACGSDFIVCPFCEATGELPSVLIRAYAFQFGTPIFLCGKGYCAVATPEGELAFSSADSPVDTEYAWKSEYHLFERRIKGKF